MAMAIVIDRNMGGYRLSLETSSRQKFDGFRVKNVKKPKLGSKNRKFVSVLC